jgi:hypothetical protein
MRPISDLTARQAERRLEGEEATGPGPDDQPTADPSPEGSATSPTEDLTAVLAQSVRVAVGAVVTAGALGGEIVRRTLGQEPATKTEEEGPPLPVLVTGAALGFAFEAATKTASVLAGAARATAPWGSWFVSATGLRGPARREAERLNDRWMEVSPGAREAAAAFARELVPEVTGALLDQLDLSSVVQERVDLERVVDGLDLDAVAARIDLDRIVGRIDLDAVASKIDVDAIVARVDLEATVRRLDTAQLAREVIEELDLLTIIRESTESVTAEAVDDIRYGAVDADRAVGRVVDRIFRRRSRTSTPPEIEPGSPPDAPS